MVRIERVETFVFRASAPEPVQTAFGIMIDRPLLLVRLTDTDGAVGWGEVWCNFPHVGAEHRARLIDTDLAPRVCAQVWHSPEDMGVTLTRDTRLQVLQTGEPGPIANCIAGLDTALHDLFARRAGLPLWQMLGGSECASVPIYASGISPRTAAASAEACRAKGYPALKFKVGFSPEADLSNVTAVRAAVGPDFPVAIDANQGWDIDAALGMMRDVRDDALAWIEEPIAVDSPDTDWHSVRNAAPATLAGGENIINRRQLDEAIASGILGILQPDLAKWGGVSGCAAVARSAMAHGIRYFPHFLGGGVGLAASAHLLAGVGGDGWLEVDFNDNPLRSDLLDGRIDDPAKGYRLDNEPGIGLTPDLAPFASFRSLCTDYRAPALSR